MTFAETIRLTRQKLLLSQEDFAKQLDVALSTVNRWETGKSKPNISTMKLIHDFCIKNKADYIPLEKSWLSFFMNALSAAEKGKKR